jgi:hypothetical protein
MRKMRAIRAWIGVKPEGIAYPILMLVILAADASLLSLSPGSRVALAQSLKAALRAYVGF